MVTNLFSRAKMLAVGVLIGVSPWCIPSDPAHAAVCGDVDASSQVNIADVVYLVNYIFAGGAPPADDAAGDFNCSNQTDIADAVFFVNFIFASGAAPCSGSNCVSGVLLLGSPDSSAVSAVREYGPMGADSAVIDSSGLLTTRLEGVLNPTATVGAVNAALNSIGGKISWMIPDGLSVTIAVPAVESQQEADSLGAILVTSGAFLIADAAFQADLNGAVEIMELPPSGTNEIYHLRQMRMPAAWNLRALVENINANVTVFVPDGYYRATPHPEIPAQTFVTGAGNVELLSTVDGNHGFCTSGIIGARHDDKNTTGVHSDPAGRLSIRSMPIGGLTMPEIISEIVENMPTGRFVLSTSFGFAKDISEFSKAKRAIQAMDWRRQARPRKDDFIHIASAGNEGMRTDDSRYAAMSSAFNVAAAYDSPFDLYGPGEIGLLDFAVLEAYWTYTLSVSPFNAVKMDNVIVVGSSDLNGNESSFSNRGSLVRAQGEDVAAPCVRVDPADVDGGCFATDEGLHISYYDGTSFSTPQVAGLAAYLLSLDPNLTNSELYTIIYNAYISSPNPGFVDGYGATLALDRSMASSTVRPTLLDVVDNTFNETPDGKFDEYDIQQFLAKFDQYEQLRSGIPDAPADYSRYDLNGDGFTGGDNFITRFDLDINNPPQFTSVTIDFDTTARSYDESILADLDILCYYANTTLFTGDKNLRDSLMVNCPNCDAGSRNAGQCEAPFSLIVRFVQLTGKSCYRFKDRPIICPVDSLFIDRDSTDIAPFEYTMPVRYDFDNPEDNPDSTLLQLGVDTHAEYDSVLQRATFDLTTGADYSGIGFLDSSGIFCTPVYYTNGTSAVYYTFDVGSGHQGVLTLDTRTELALYGEMFWTSAFCYNRVIEVTPAGNVMRYIDSLRVNNSNPIRQLQNDTTLTLQPGRYIIIRNIQPVGSTIGSCAHVTAYVGGYLRGTLQISPGGGKYNKSRAGLPKTLAPNLLEISTEITPADPVLRR